MAPPPHHIPPAAPPRSHQTQNGAGGASRVVSQQQQQQSQQQQRQHSISWQQGSPSSSSACCADMETPLVAHGNRKNWNRQKEQEQQQQLQQEQEQALAASDSRLGNTKRLSTLYSTLSLEAEQDEQQKQQHDGSSFSDIDDKEDIDNDDNDDDDDNRSLATNTSSMASSFRDSLMLPFVDDDGDLRDVAAGLTALAAVGALVGLCMPKNMNLVVLQPHQDDENNDQEIMDDAPRPLYYYGYLYYSAVYPWISSVLGYTYTLLWSSCFYPQVLLNYRRQSTAGLSPDFALLNFMGWTFYAVYLSGMFFSHDIQQLYQQRFAKDRSSVQSNDVLFAVHAALLSLIYLVQIVYYRIQNRKRQRIIINNNNRHMHNEDDHNETIFLQTKHSLNDKPLFPLHRPTWFLVWGMGVPALVVPVLIFAGLVPYKHWLGYFYALSYMKLCCTIIKYSKQVLHNYRRQSTRGWNIWYNFLEASGGALSMLQVVLDSLAMNDVTGITGNMAKFVLGLATLGFDVSRMFWV